MIVLDDHGLVVVMVPPVMMMPDDYDWICICRQRLGQRHHRKSSKRQNKLPHWDISLMFSHRGTIPEVKERSKWSSEQIFTSSRSAGFWRALSSINWNDAGNA
jgi:hypothetical protein